MRDLGTDQKSLPFKGSLDLLSPVPCSWVSVFFLLMDPFDTGLNFIDQPHSLLPSSCHYQAVPYFPLDGTLYVIT